MNKKYIVTCWVMIPGITDNCDRFPNYIFSSRVRLGKLDCHYLTISKMQLLL